MNIYEAIASIMETGYAVEKEKRNNTQGFMYRGIDDVMNTFQPLMAKAGIFVVPEVLEATREERQTAKGGNLIYSVLKIRYTFYASDGTSVSAVVIGEGMDSGDKASNKAMAVGMKYAMFQVFCIPTEEMTDPDVETAPESVSKAKTAKNTTPAEKATQAAKKAAKEPVVAPDGNLYCAECGEEITKVKVGGEVRSEKEIAMRGIEKHGRQLCWNCQKKHAGPTD